jgi:hypothetical protein
LLQFTLLQRCLQAEQILSLRYSYFFQAEQILSLRYSFFWSASEGMACSNFVLMLHSSLSTQFETVTRIHKYKDHMQAISCQALYVYEH